MGGWVGGWLGGVVVGGGGGGGGRGAKAKKGGLFVFLGFEAIAAFRSVALSLL